MTGYLMNVFILLLLVWKVGALDNETNEESPVKVEVHKPRETVIEDSQVSFHCVTSCPPSISNCATQVKWGFKTQSNPLPAAVILLNSSVIHFPYAVPGHSGRYYCWVESFPQITAFGELTVRQVFADCQENVFKCEDGKCIFRDYLCDGNDNCGDNSDESNCSSPIPTTPAIPTTRAKPVTSARPNKHAPATGKVQNTTGIIVGVTLAVVLLVLVGIGAAIFLKKKRTTAGEEVANTNNSNRPFPMKR